MEEPIIKIKAELADDNGNLISGFFKLWETTEDESDFLRLTLEFRDISISVKSAEGVFDALTIIRNKLRPLGYIPKCYGACLNVFPSGMVRSMGMGEKAYMLTLGKPALSKDLVNVLEFVDGEQYATVEEQEQFYEQWFDSL